MGCSDNQRLMSPTRVTVRYAAAESEGCCHTSSKSWALEGSKNTIQVGDDSHSFVYNLYALKSRAQSRRRPSEQRGQPEDSDSPSHTCHIRDLSSRIPPQSLDPADRPQLSLSSSVLCLKADSAMHAENN